jgi:transcriptional regulator with XRE-family HTH domain
MPYNYHPVAYVSTLCYKIIMFLYDYLKMTGVSQKQFAESCGVSQAAICRLLKGQRFPSPKTIHTILLVTDGHVRAEDWFRQAIGEGNERVS